jgi:hypothetical protein
MAVQTQIQVRRGTAASWTSTNPTLAAGEIGFESDTNKFKIGTGALAWGSLAYANDGDITEITAGIGISGGGTSGNVTVTNSMATAIDAKGDLIVGTGSDTFVRQAVGTDGQILVADSAQADGLKWADNTSPYNISIKVPAGTAKDSVSATYTLPAGVYTVQGSGAGINTVTYGANSFTPASAANGIIQDLASTTSSISITLNRNWTGNPAVGVTGNVLALNYANGYFTLSGTASSQQAAAYTANGSSWGTFTLFTSGGNSCRGVLRDATNTYWIANLVNASAAYGVYTSPDGVTWTTRATTFVSPTNIHYANNLYIITGTTVGTGSINSSTDGITWTSRAAGFGANTPYACAWNGSLYAVGGDNGALRTSTDLVTWTNRTSQFGANQISNINYVNNLLIATGGAGTMSSSTDGITWVARTSGATGSSVGIGWDGTLYGVGGSTGNTFRTSTDLITWTVRTVTGSGKFVAYGGGIGIMTAGAGNAAYTSYGSIAGGTTVNSYATLSLGTPVTVA